MANLAELARKYASTHPAASDYDIGVAVNCAPSRVREALRKRGYVRHAITAESNVNGSVDLEGLLAARNLVKAAGSIDAAKQFLESWQTIASLS